MTKKTKPDDKNASASEEKKKAGRPTTYTDELSDLICERLAAGESMRSVSRDESMPAMSTLFKWLRENEKFSEQYTRAKEESADALVEEILDIADDGTNDWMERKNKEGDHLGWQLNGEHVQRSKLRVDTRKWAASKLKPKKYGDRIINENRNIPTYEDMSDEDLRAHRQQLEKQLENSTKD